MGILAKTFEVQPLKSNNGELELPSGLCLFQLKRQMDLATARNLSTTVKRLGGGYVAHGGDACKTPTKLEIGNREIVGYGINGTADYADSHDHWLPMPRLLGCEG